MFVNSFRYLDYREAIRAEVEARKTQGDGITFQKLADRIKVQAPYVSKVLNLHAQFSRDQLFETLAFLEASDDEVHYLEILHDLATTGIESRRLSLQKKAKVIQAKQQDTRNVLSQVEVTDARQIDDYYLDPFNQIVHVCLSIQRYQIDLDLLAEDLLISRDRVRQCVQLLHKLGLAIRIDKGFKSVENPLYLSKDSKLYGAWINQLRQLSMVRRVQISNDLSYGFTAVFSANEDVKFEIQRKILQLISELQHAVENSNPQEVYQINMDLLPWTRKKS